MAEKGVVFVKRKDGLATRVEEVNSMHTNAKGAGLRHQMLTHQIQSREPNVPVKGRVGLLVLHAWTSSGSGGRGGGSGWRDDDGGGDGHGLGGLIKGRRR